MNNSNPILTEKALENIDYQNSLRQMTVSNTMSKFVILLILMMASASAVYYQFLLNHYDFVNMLMYGGMFIGLILAFIVAFKPKSTMYVAPIYAFAEGAFISGISCYFEKMFPGIVIQAVSLTFAVAFVMAALYTSKVIKVSEKFRSVLISLTFSIAIFYLIGLILSWGFHYNLQILYAATPISFGFSIFVSAVAALNLLIDFDFIERAIENKAPEEFGWYGAFGLLVTLVWLYVEILRLISKFRSR